jgi:hypothetical protein
MSLPFLSSSRLANQWLPAVPALRAQAAEIISKAE